MRLKIKLIGYAAWNELDPSLRLLKKPLEFKLAVNNSSLPLSLVTLSVT